jgi:hypothetical protein
LNPDAFIVRTNLARPAATRPFDAEYATTLGADAVPVLLDALPRLEPADQCIVASSLLKRWYGKPRDWRTWNWSRSRAIRLVTGRAESLRAAAPRNVPCKGGKQ